MSRGHFISFEGIDGSGKTTQINLIHAWLLSRGVDAVVTREPGSTPIGQEIRRILLDSKTVGITPVAEALLYYASRVQNVGQVIQPALDAGKTVLCDRFHDASWAYQGFGRKLGVEFMRALDDLALNGFHPDHTILIDIDVATSVARARTRNTTMSADENRFESEAKEFFEQVLAGYDWMARREPGRFHWIDGNRSIEAIHQDVIKLFEAWNILA